MPACPLASTAAKTFAETGAWSKILVEDPTDRIIGAQIIGHASEELINIFGIAIAYGITASQIRDFVFAYPTFSADVPKQMTQNRTGRSLRASGDALSMSVPLCRTAQT